MRLALRQVSPQWMRSAAIENQLRLPLWMRLRLWRLWNGGDIRRDAPTGTSRHGVLRRSAYAWDKEPMSRCKRLKYFVLESDLEMESFSRIQIFLKRT